MTRHIRNIIGVVLCLFFVLPQLEAQQIKYAEYFFDNDPGRGSGTSVSITQANTIDANFSISTASLSSGIHFLFFRMKDTDAKWSLVNSRLLYITPPSSSSSNIVAAEYFFDNDPGQGSGTSVSISSGSTVDFTKSIATASLSSGIHYLFFRIKSSNGKWSLTDSKLLYVTESSTSANITAAEYFFDNDPGFGSATALAVTSGSTINTSSTISVASLSAGLHNIYLRVKTSNGKWSLAESRLLFKSNNYSNANIVAAEYFYDNDPGHGNATAITISAGDTINLTTPLSTTGLSSGIHLFYLRVKDGNGKWSLNTQKMVYIKAGNLSAPSITAAEYFFDTDPGNGNATSLTPTAGNTIDITAAIASSGLGIGHHQFFVRAKDSLGHWSICERRMVYVSPTLANQKISAIEYSVDTIMPFGQGTIINLTPIDSLDYTFNFTHGLTDTFYHALYTRVKTVGGQWSLLDSVMFRMENCIIPTAQFSINDICFGDSITLTNSSLDTDTSSIYEWNIGDDSSVESTDSTSFTVGFSQSGKYQISLKVTNFVCIDTIIKTIHVNPRPDTTISTFGNTTFCPGNFSVLSANSGIGYQYQWLKNGNPISNATSNFYQASDSGTYQAAITNIYNCSDTTSAIDITVFNLPTAAISNSGNNILCQGDSITLTANQVAGLTYQWYKNGDTIQSANNSSINVSISGDYKVEITNINGCSDISSSISIAVNPSPNALITAGGSTIFCSGGNVNLYASSGVSYAYQWFKDGNTISGATSSYYAANQSGNYSVNISNAYQCGDSSSIESVVVNPSPISQFTIGGSSTLCAGDSLIFDAVGNANYSYQWERNGVNISGTNDSLLFASQSGNYKLTTTNSFNCSTISNSQAIIVNPRPNATITNSGADTICQGEQLNIYGSAGIGLSYQWLRNDTAITSSTSMTHLITQSGNYQVVISNTYSCSDTSNTKIITVNPNPVSSISFTGQNTICQGDTVKLSGPSTAGLSYQWKSYGTNISGATDSILNALQTGNYSLITTNIYNCSTESAQILATVNPVPGSAILPLTSTSFCGGDSVILQASAGSGLSYQWFENSIPLNNDTSIRHTANSTGSFSVAITNNFNCSSISSTTNVTVFPIPTSSFNLDSAICSSDTVQILYTGSASAGAFYNWNFGGATILNGTGQGPYNVKWASAGIKTVSLMVNENACSSVSFADSTLVKTVSAFITAPLTSVCQGDTLILTANSGQNLSYQWIQGGLALANDTLSQLYVSNSGNYQIKVSDLLIGCAEYSTPVIVNVYPTDFNLAFSAPTTSFSQPPFDIVFNNNTPNMNNYSFQWELGDGNTSTFYNPLHTYLFNGNYTVSMYAENSSTGCRDTLVKQNYISCTGGSPNPCNIIAAITPPGPATICAGDSVLLAASAGANYAYQWAFNNMIIPSADSIIFFAKQSGNYRVIITDSVCSQTSPAFILNHYPSIQPAIQATGNIQPCTNDSLQLSLLVNYNSYNWTTGDTIPSIYVQQTAYYQVAVTDNYGCNMISAPYVVSNSFLNPPELCIVGVDSANHNRLIWERQSNALIDSFYVYKEGFIANQYNQIGAIPFSQTSLFVDTNSNPATQAYRYKIAAVDTCGGVTLLSNFHKTIHLTINAGLNGSWNLIWDGYLGFQFNTYRIYRGPNTNNMSLLTQLPSSATSYTDLNPPTGTVYYQIEVIKNAGCYPDTTYAKANTNYNYSRSNTANNGNITPVFLSSNFSANVLTGVWPVQVQFTDNSTGYPDDWYWSFGDGNTSIEQNPAHTYNNTGLYTVKLRICNGTICDTIIKTDYIEVLPNGIVEIGVAIAAKLYPNPNDGSFVLEINDRKSHDLDLHIYNTLGDEVYSVSFKTQGISKKRINLKHLPKGVYYLILNNNEALVYRAKVIIQ